MLLVLWFDFIYLVGNRSLISLQPKIEASWFKLPTPTISFLFMGPSYFCDWSLCICIDLTLLPHIHLTLLPDITVTKKYVFLQLIFWFSHLNKVSFLCICGCWMLITEFSIHVHMVLILMLFLDLNFVYLKLLCFAYVCANAAGSK